MSDLVKSEQSDANETKITSALRSNPKGLSGSELMEITGWSLQDVVDTLNRLIDKHAIILGKLPDNSLIYRLKSTPSSANQPRDIDAAERLIYNIIEEAGTKGIWNKDIQEMCKVPAKQLDKLLKSLEGKKLVKKLNPAGSSRKRIYLLHNLVPDDSVTGGIFYSNQKFDTQFVEHITSCCLRILQQKVEESKTKDLDLMELKQYQFLSSQDILKSLTEKNICKVKLTLPDVEAIMQTLIFDGKIEKDIIIDRRDSTETSLYRATSPFIHSSSLMHTPCGHCPVRDDCRPGSTIGPEKCIYMSAWLDF